MKRFWKLTASCLLTAVFFWFGTLLADRQTLREEIVRLHVVGRTNSAVDQSIKLRVKDAVTEYLKTEMKDIPDAEQAKGYLEEHLPQIREAANDALTALGEEANAEVSFRKEEFPVRRYDTFTLPAGIYDSLRITIGEGEGRNWWCVVFPTLCYSATSEELESVAAGAGFSEALTGAITGETEYEIRFFFLDALGRLENILHRE